MPHPRVPAFVAALAIAITTLAPAPALADSIDLLAGSYASPGNLGLVIQDHRSLGLQESQTSDGGATGTLLAGPCVSAGDEFCIEGLRGGIGGPLTDATYLGSAAGNTVGADGVHGVPAGSTVSLWDIPGVVNAAGTTTYAVALDIDFSIVDDGYVINNAGAVVTPYSTKLGSYPTSGYPGCVFSGGGECGVLEDFATGTRIGLDFRMPSTVGGWFRGRITQPVIAVTPLSETGNRVSVEADVTAVPAVGVGVPAELALSAFGITVPEPPESTDITIAGAAPTAPAAIDAVKPLVADTATATVNTWSFTQLPNATGDCWPDASQYVGFVSTNAMAYDDSPPEFADGELKYGVAGMRYAPDGSVYDGTYDLVLRGDVARCLYGFSDDPIGATVSVEDDGQAQSGTTTSVVEADGWLRVSVAGIHFSAPEISVTITQEQDATFITAPVPTVGGEVSVGSLLTATPGVWEPQPDTFDYRWTRDGADIAGATAATYTVSAADAGTSLAVMVTATKDGLLAVQRTSAARFVPSLLTASPTPTITGTWTIGTALTAAPGAWAPAPVSFAYQWTRDGVAISGAVASAYTPVPADAGRSIAVSVTGSRPDYESITRTSAAKVVLRALTASPVPVVTGSTSIGGTLTSTAGAWGPAPVSLSYQWKRNGVAIVGATTPTYTLTSSDRAKSITVAVTGSKKGYAAVVRSSAQKIVYGAFSASPVPTISGSAAIRAVLTANPGAWAPAPSSLSYQWMRNGVAIVGATSATYQTLPADAGKSITVVVVGARTYYRSVTKISLPRVVERALTAAPIPIVTGIADVGRSLTATAGVWAPSPVVTSFQWRRDGARIAGATKASYVLTAADAGTSITVTVVGTKAGYTTVSRTSAAKPVNRVLTASPIPAVSGTVRVGSTVSAVTGPWAPAPVALAYQWKRDGVPIAGATAATYTLVAADATRSLTVTVKGTKSGYTAIARTSAAALVQGVLTASPTPSVGGSTVAGNVLSASVGTWSPAPVTIAYQWLRNGSRIGGATRASYVSVAADVGTSVSVRVTGTKANYLGATRTSSGVWITAPSKPADVNCSDFATHAAAVAFYLYWYPYYGDFADLDGNDDGNPCESLR
jgi:hypothetical protein